MKSEIRTRNIQLPWSQLFRSLSCNTFPSYLSWTSDIFQFAFGDGEPIPIVRISVISNEDERYDTKNKTNRYYRNGNVKISKPRQQTSRLRFQSVSISIKRRNFINDGELRDIFKERERERKRKNIEVLAKYTEINVTVNIYIYIYAFSSVSR